MKVAIVTGGAGFIGSHVVDRLLARDSIVVAIDSLACGRLENLAAAEKSKRFNFIKADLSEPLDSWVATVKKHIPKEAEVDVWHLAANSDIAKGSENPEVDLKDTFLTTYRTLELARLFNSKKFYFASTSAVYGERREVLTEDLGPLLPISNYGAMKLASEGAISAAVERFLKQAIIFRFPNVIGSRGTHGALFDFVKKLTKNPKELEVLGDGNQTKPYLHVSELVEAMFALVDSFSGHIDCFNIGVLEGVTSVKFIAEEVCRQLSPEAKIVYTGGAKGWIGDVPKFQLSTDKISRYGWRSKMSSNDAVVMAVCELIDDFKARGRGASGNAELRRG